MKSNLFNKQINLSTVNKFGGRSISTGCTYTEYTNPGSANPDERVTHYDEDGNVIKDSNNYR